MERKSLKKQGAACLLAHPQRGHWQPQPANPPTRVGNAVVDPTASIYK
jgi:hypothetical protein